MTKSKFTPSKAPKGQREIRIHIMPEGGRSAIMYATSLRDALEKFHKGHFEAEGFEMNIVGNVMTVWKGRKRYTYHAYEG